jgi:hypothetical protein
MIIGSEHGFDSSNTQWIVRFEGQDNTESMSQSLLGNVVTLDVLFYFYCISHHASLSRLLGLVKRTVLGFAVGLAIGVVHGETK